MKELGGKKMALTKDQIQEKINEVLETGMWMIRRSNNGASCHNGFQWAPIGEWTVAPDWNPVKECGGGLHGNGPLSKGHWANGRDIDFCAVENVVDIDGEKIKCEKAMVLLRNELPYIKSFVGDFNVSGCDLSNIKLPESIGGSIYASGCDLSGIKLQNNIHIIQ